MKFILLLVVYLITAFSVLSQPYAVQGDATCGCEVLIYTVDRIAADALGPPQENPVLDPDPHVLTGGPMPSDIGYLDDFMRSSQWNCERSVFVKVRKIKSLGIEYYYDYMVNDVYTLMERYRNYSIICFKGHFEFSQTIDIRFGQVVKLLGDTNFNYEGDGLEPGIAFKGIGASIQGGQINTGVPMNNGLISIASKGSVKGDNPQNRLYNQIKNTKLLQENSNNYGPNQLAREDRGIVLSNTFESVISQRDNGSNFYANINNVDIDGFAVGMHCRGWSNAALIRDLEFNNVSAYGVWVSGGADNSFTNLTYKNCSGYAIRLDNYVDTRYEQYGLSDPNNRVEIFTQDLINDNGLSNTNNQSEFNGLLDALYGDNDGGGVTEFFSIVDACGKGGIIDEVFNNKEREDDLGLRLEKFGLREFDLDDQLINGQSRYSNYPTDNIDVSSVLNSPSNSQINFYTNTFNHPQTQLQVTLNEPTCKTSAGLTVFYLRPFTNSFTGVNIFNAQGELQVGKLVEVAEREDDGNICQDIDANTPCSGSGCIYNINGTNFYALGARNNIVLCNNVPSSFNINGNDSVELSSNCDLTGNNGVPVLTITKL